MHPFGHGCLQNRAPAGEKQWLSIKSVFPLESGSLFHLTACLEASLPALALGMDKDTHMDMDLEVDMDTDMDTDTDRYGYGYGYG